MNISTLRSAAPLRPALVIAAWGLAVLAPRTLAQITVWIPPVTTEVWHEPWTETVWVPPVMGIRTVPAVTHVEQVPEQWHYETRQVTKVIDYPETTTTVYHPASTTTVHHDAVTRVVHHDEETIVVHIDEQSHVEYHPEETHTEYEEGYYDSVWVDEYEVWCEYYCEWIYDEYSEGGNYECWEVDCWEEWVGGHWEDVWVDGYEYTVTTGAWEELVIDVEEHDEYVTIPAWDEEVTDPAWDEVVTTPEWNETVVVPAHSETVVTTEQVKVVDVPAHEITVVDVPAHEEEYVVTEGHHETVNHEGWMETVVLVPGYWKTVTAAASKQVLSGDDPDVTWASSHAESLQTPLYSADLNGDQVAWSVSLSDSVSIINYRWTATGPETIAGPSGSSASQWLIADTQPSSGPRRLTWRPGTYTIKCEITASNGQSTEAKYDQRVGWRTARYLVAGQVRPISDFALTSTQITTLRTDLAEDIVEWLRSYPFNSWILTTAFESTIRSMNIDDLSILWVMTCNLQAIFNGNDPRVHNLPNTTSEMKFWWVQNILNRNPDLVDLTVPAVNIDSTKLNELLAQHSYRMYSDFQAKYMVDANYKIEAGTLFWTGDCLNGLTKLALPASLILALDDVGLRTALAAVLPSVFNGTQLLIPARMNPNSVNPLYVDRVNGQVSLYTSGRVGWEGTPPNYAMFERDVPYIFNEIIIGLDTAGRDHLNRVRLSVNRVWNQDGSESGLRYFNNVAIYQRDNGTTTYTRLALYEIGGGAGMLQPFIGSVPLFQKQTVPTVPAVQNAP